MLELATLIWRHARYRGDAVAVVLIGWESSKPKTGANPIGCSVR